MIEFAGAPRERETTTSSSTARIVLKLNVAFGIKTDFGFVTKPDEDLRKMAIVMSNRPTTICVFINSIDVRELKSRTHKRLHLRRLRYLPSDNL